jgi:hypothetical protein
MVETTGLKGWMVTLEGLLTRKRVLIGLGAAYWAGAVGLAYLFGSLEQKHITFEMRDPARFTPGDPHTLHMVRAAVEQGTEAAFVSLLVFGALFGALIVAWRVYLLLNSEAAARRAERRAARRARFEEVADVPDPLVPMPRAPLPDAPAE